MLDLKSDICHNQRKQNQEGGEKMAEVKGYCVKCKKKTEMKDPKAVTLKNGRKATKGECPKCGTKMFRIGG